MGILSDTVVPMSPEYREMMAKAKGIGSSETFLKARDRVRQNKDRARASFELTDKQRSEKGKRKFWTIAGGLLSGNPAAGILNAYGSGDDYEDRTKYNNYLENRLAMHGLSKQEEGGLMARRYNQESFSSTSPSTAASRGGTWSNQWYPGDTEGREEAHGLHSTTGKLMRLIGPDGEPIPDRERRDPYQIGATEVRTRTNERAEIRAARATWRAMPDSQKILFRKKILKGGIRDKAAEKFLRLILGEYEGMDPAEKREIENYLFGDAETRAAKAANRAAPTRSSADVGADVDVLDGKLGIR